MICDFGMARTFPFPSDDAKEFQSFRKNEYKKILKSKDKQEYIKRENKFKDNIGKVLLTDQDKRYAKVRDMTPTVNTRWYRSPEVIMCDVNYNLASDIWSLGCILAEMLNCTKT